MLENFKSRLKVAIVEEYRKEYGDAVRKDAREQLEEEARSLEKTEEEKRRVARVKEELR